MKAETRRALVIDDDAATRLTACAVLEKLGVQPVEAACGEQGLERLAQRDIDLILLDVEMPGLDGFETCNAIRRAVDVHVPVVMMTGRDDIASVQRAFEVGATDFVMKPVNWLVLEQRLGYVLRASATSRELLEKQSALDLAQQIARLGSFSFNPETGRVTGSEQFRRLYCFPRSATSLELERLLERVHSEDRKTLRDALHSCAEDGQAVSLDHRLSLTGATLQIHHVEIHPRGPGSPWVDGIAQDVTERKANEERIRYLAFHDSLTGVGNLRAFRDKLGQALAAAQRRNGVVGLLFIDLDRFKRINDTHGHRAGDEVLRQIADRLCRTVRSSDFVGRSPEAPASGDISRLGGDEFTVLLTDIREPRDAGRIARRILSTVQEPIEIPGAVVTVGASIGIAVHPFDGMDEEDLLRSADAAMYHAKELDGDGFQYYDESMNGDAARRLALEQKLRAAIPAGHICVHYQPKVSLETGEITGAEALARWLDPELGFVPPDQFIPVAEECALIGDLSARVLRSACSDAVRWHAAGLGPLCVAVNLSPQQLSDGDLPAIVERTLRETGLEAHYLEVELTESALIRDEKRTERTLRALDELGVRIALDDFGTGYSSLTYLKRFPVRAVKIDRSFVKDLEFDADNAAITRAIVSMGRALGLKVVAEGVENEAQRKFLAELSCDEEQGYRFSPPVPVEAFEAMLAEHGGRDLPRSNPEQMETRA